MRSSGADVSLLSSVLGVLNGNGELAILGKTHVLCESGVRHPSGRLARGTNFLHHPVDLLKGETLSLPDEEVGVDEAENTSASPNEEDLGTEVGLVGTDEVRGDDGNDTVPEPVGGGGETDTARSDADGEDLSLVSMFAT